MTQPQEKASFNGLGLSEKLLQILQKQNFTVPTPIQHQCIKPLLEGKDVVGIAQTGTGKTLAFGLPMIQRIAELKGQGLILLPTRELALQVEEVLRKIGGPLGLKTAVLIGGASLHMQVQALRRNPHVIVATPGRLVDHLMQRNVSLQNVKMVVLDEADRMLDIGFMPQIVQILKATPANRQTLMFSATMPHAIAQLANHHMKLPLRIEVALAGTPAAAVEQEIFITPRELKMQLLDKILAENPGTVLLFSRTKHGAKRIARGIRDMGHSAVELHSNRTLAQRRDAMDGFKSGKYRILVATDIAARGIDVTNIALVINFDLPSNSEDYVHRIGRTGRAGSSGKAVSFATPDERGEIRQIERLIRKTIRVLPLPVLPPRRIASGVIVEQGQYQGNYPPRRRPVRKNDMFRGRFRNR